MTPANIHKIPQCREMVSVSNVSQVETLVRNAERAGLHQNIPGLNFNAIQSQGRRLLWYQICFLDQHVADSHGLQPSIQDDGCQNLLPFNVNDEDLNCVYPFPTPNRAWTDVTFALMRYEFYLVHRLIISQMKAIENKLTDLNTARKMIERARRMVEERYRSIVDERIPIQRYANLICRLLSAKCDMMLLGRHIQFDVNSPFQSAIREM